MHVYSSDDSRSGGLAAIAVGAVVLAIIADAVFRASGLGPTWLLSAPTVATAFGLLYGLMERHAWRWKWVRVTGLIHTPVIDGTYAGRLLAPPFEPGRPETDRPITVKISQTWTRVGIEFWIDDPKSSTSHSFTAQLRQVGHDGAQLTYTYTNRVQPGVADPDMGDHDGTATLVISDDGKAHGRYYNFRGRQGTLELRRIGDL